MTMHSWVTAVLAAGAALGMLAVVAPAEARGVGGGRAGGFVGGHGWGGRPSVAFRGGFGHHRGHVWHGRAGHRYGWNRGHRGFGYDRGFGRYGGYGYGAYGGGGLPYLYGSPGYGGNNGYPGPYPGASSQPEVGIRAAPVLPPAIYVIGKQGRGSAVRERRGGPISAGSYEARGGSGVVVTRGSRGSYSTD